MTPRPPSDTLAPRPSRRAIGLGLAIATAVALVSGLIAPSAANAADPPQTVVSFTFDDGNANQVPAAQILNAKGMKGTFFVNSGTIGLTDYLSLSELQALSAAGNEIGGHTVNHPYLDTLPTDEAKRQICLDRNTLLGWGFNVRNFAYPFAITNATLQGLVQACGYNSGRQLGDIATRFGCEDCAHAETIPPAAPYETKALDEVEPEWLLSDFEKAVTDAESSGGGWVQFTFHNFCATGTTCGELSVKQDVFTDFVNWLSTRNTTNNTVVKTVGDVIGGTTKAAVPVAPPVTSTGIVNPGFETIASGASLPTCWGLYNFGTGTAVADTTTGRTGARGGRVVVSNYAAPGDARLMPALDLGTCSPAVTPGKYYALSGWYKSTAQTQFAVYLRNSAGGWEYWTSSPSLFESTTFTRATWTTPVIPAGYTGISFGLNIQANGTIVVDDFAIADADTLPVTTATPTPAAPNGTAGWYTSVPTVALTVPDTALATTTQYSFNGGTTWTTYTTPIPVPTSSTLSYRSITDRKTEATKTLVFKIDTVAPVVVPTFTASTRALKATATDATSGVAAIEVKIGSAAWKTFTPGTAGAAAATYQFRARDNAGNVSASVSIAVPGTVAGSQSPNPSTSSPAPSPAPSPAKLNTAVAVTLPQATVRYGKPATAVVHFAEGTVPATGTVSVQVDGVWFTDVVATAGSATVPLGSTLKAGTHQVSASFAGDATRNASASAAVKLVSSKASSKVTLAVKTTKPTLRKTKLSGTVTVTTKKSTAPITGEVQLNITHAGVTKIRYYSLKTSAHGKLKFALPAFKSKGGYVIRARFTGPNVVTATSSSVRLSVKAR